MISIVMNNPRTGFFSQKTALFFVGFIFFSNAFLNLKVWAATDDLSLPAGASAEVISSQINQDAQEELSRSVTPQIGDIKKDEEKSPVLDSRPFFVKRIILSGDLILPEAEYSPIIKSYESRELSFKDVREAMSKIEAVFRAKGYLAVVSLPPQKLENQEIRMELIASRMGDLTVDGNRWFNERLIRRHWNIAAGEYLKYDGIRQAAIKMSGNSDRLVRPVLKAGKEKRTTDIILKVEDHFPGHADFTFDNQGVKLTGEKRFGLMLRHNNFLGLDDTLLVGTSFGNRFGALFANYVLPLNTIGTSLTGNYSHAQVNPKKEFESLGINSVSDTFGLGLKQDVFQTERFSGGVSSNFTFKEKHTRILSVITSWDKARVLDFSGTLQERDSLGGTSLHQTISFGMPGRGDGYPLASRGGEHSFFKYRANLSRQLKMPWKTYFLANGEAQLSPDRLLPTEQMFMGGADSVRGYPESDYGADQGTILQLEYWVPTSFFPETWHLPWDATPLRNRLKFLTFFDQGYGRVRSPTSSETKSSYLVGTGFGGDFAFRENFSLRIEWGFRLGDRPATEGGDNQVHFRLRSGI